MPNEKNRSFEGYMDLIEEQRCLIQKELSAIIGQPLSDMWRYVGFQKFEFGEQKLQVNRRGREINVADRSLVTNGAWSIEGPSGFFLCSKHFGCAPDRSDDHAKPFYQSLADDPPIVDSVDVSNQGELKVRMSGGYFMRIDPPRCDADDADCDEEWRFMPPDNDPRGHLVLDGQGLSWSQGE